MIKLTVCREFISLKLKNNQYISDKLKQQNIDINPNQKEKWKLKHHDKWSPNKQLAMNLQLKMLPNSIEVDQTKKPGFTREFVHSDTDKYFVIISDADDKEIIGWAMPI